MIFFETRIMEYFRESVKKRRRYVKKILRGAGEWGGRKRVEGIFESYLKKTISIRDTFVRKPMKENFYHGILLGILGCEEEWGVFSNRETGNHDIFL